MKYAHENGCPWNEETCSEAAKNDHLECLEYARENGCPWDEEMFDSETVEDFSESESESDSGESW